MQVKINNQLHDAVVTGDMPDRYWDGRDSKTITLTGTYADAAALFADGVAWSIVQTSTVPVLDADGNPTSETTEKTEEWDNSDYSTLGDITVHRDGTVSIKMGKPTDAERLAAALEKAGVTVYA